MGGGGNVFILLYYILSLSNFQLDDLCKWNASVSAALHGSGSLKAKVQLLMSLVRNFNL